MNANELADWIENGAPFGKYETAKQAVVMLRQQQAEREALYNLVAEQDKKIVELAFKLAYAERGNEIVLEANTRSRP